MCTQKKLWCFVHSPGSVNGNQKKWLGPRNTLFQPVSDHRDQPTSWDVGLGIEVIKESAGAVVSVLNYLNIFIHHPALQALELENIITKQNDFKQNKIKCQNVA